MANIFKFTFKHAFLSKPFIIAALVALGAGAYEILGYMGEWADCKVEDAHLFSENNAIYILIFIVAILPPILTGREASNGTIRNKLITGTSKTGFFVSHLAVNSILSVFITLLYFLPTMIILPKYYNMFQPYMVIFAIGCSALGYITITAISTAITVMCKNIIISIVACAGAIFILLLVNAWLGKNLTQSRMEDVYETGTYDNEYGKYSESEEVDEQLNPFFIADKTERTLMWTGTHLMPFEAIANGVSIIDGHVTSIDQYKQYKAEAEKLKDTDPVLYERNSYLFYVPLYTMGTAIVVSILGVILFKRRNIA